MLIKELPVGMWTANYKKFVKDLVYDKSADAKLQKSQMIEDFKDLTNKVSPALKLFFNRETYLKVKDMTEEKLRKTFKLTSSYSETNMYLFNKDNVIQKFKSANAILDYYFDIRLDYYQKRKDAMIKFLAHQVEVLKNKVRLNKTYI